MMDAPSTAIFRPEDKAAGLAQRLKMGALRDRFMSDPTTDLSSLRPMIARSWQRSQISKVSPSQRVLDSLTLPQLDEQFLRLAEPTLSELENLCRDARGCISVSDPQGTIAVFRGDSKLVKWADRMFPTFGGCMSEGFAGTNSDGTALEENSTVQVWGGEHFNEAFADTYCSSVIIRDPLRSTVRAVLSLTLPEQLVTGLDPRAVLLILRGAAAEITANLTARLAPAEQALLGSYLRETRKRGTDAVVAMDDKTTIASRAAMQLLEQDDYAVLAAYAREAQYANRPLEREVWCADRLLNIQVRPVAAGDAAAGTVMRVSKVEKPEKTIPTSVALAPRSHFDSLVGKSLAHRRAIEVATTAMNRGMGAYLVGEAGTGKRHLAMALGDGLAGRTHCFDAAGSDAPLDLGKIEEHLSRGDAVVVTRVDKLGPETCQSLAMSLSAFDKPRVVLTMRKLSDELLPLISAVSGVEIQMPSLCTRREDIPLLVNHFLGSCRHRASARLIETLAGAEWTENVKQLKEVVEAAAVRSTSYEVKVDDLTELHRRQLARNRLSRLEQAELELIREALIEAGGNRVRAAELLRIGRSTLYRKIDSYTCRGFEIELS